MAPGVTTISSTNNVSVTTTTVTSSSRSSSSHMLNLQFIRTPLGFLQIIATVLNVVCVGIIGNAVTFRYPGSNFWWITGWSFMMVFLMLVFMCLIITALIVITSLTSFGTSTLLPKTSFFVAYHFVATIFYLCTSISILSQVKYVTNYYSTVLAAGVFGIFTTIVYGALLAFSLLHYMRS